MKPLLNLRRSGSLGSTSKLAGGSEPRKHRSYLSRDGSPSVMPALLAVSVFAGLVFLCVHYATPASAQASPSGDIAAPNGWPAHTTGQHPAVARNVLQVCQQSPNGAQPSSASVCSSQELMSCISGTKADFVVHLMHTLWNAEQHGFLRSENNLARTGLADVSSNQQQTVFAGKQEGVTTTSSRGASGLHCSWLLPEWARTNPAASAARCVRCGRQLLLCRRAARLCSSMGRNPPVQQELYRCAQTSSRWTRSARPAGSRSASTGVYPRTRQAPA